MKNTVALVCIFMLSFGGYVTYRYISVPTVADTKDWIKIQSLPATVCEFSAGGFENSQTGVLYIHKGHIRISSVYQEGGGTVPVQLIMMPDRSTYTWTDGDPRGFFVPSDEPQSYTGAFGKISCAPWWFPDASFFDLPSLVVFE